MSEISDLQPDRPAIDVLTPAQVSLYLKAHNAERQCEACGHAGWQMCPEKNAAFAEQRGTVILACRQCSTLRTILRPPVMAWMKENRSA